MNRSVISLLLIVVCITGCVRIGKHKTTSPYIDLRPKESQAHSIAREEYEEQKFSTPSWAYSDQDVEDMNEADDYLENYEESHRLK